MIANKKNKKKRVPELRFGEFDEEWEILPIDKITDTVTSGSRDWAKFYSLDGDKFIRMTNLSRNGIQLLLDNLKYVKIPKTNSEGKRTSLQYGDLLISITAELGKIGWVPNDLGVAYINQHTALVRIKTNFESKFIAYQLSSYKSNITLNRLNDSGAKSGLNLSTIRSYKVTFPSLPEQKKIATFLSTIDQKIQQLTRKKKLLESYKKGLMQQLFSGKLRFRDEEGKEYPDWQYVHGNELFDLISDKNHNSDLPILAITQDQGAIPRDMINYKMTVTKKSIASYKVVQIGDFIISLRTFQGGIEYSEYHGICSPAYNILRPNSKDVNKDFYKLYLKTSFYIQQLQRNLEGIRDGKMISYKYFSEIKLPFPSPSEQERIANFLLSIDKKIAEVITQITKTQTFKRGLLQKMFV